jgi:hypothetical protein
MAAGKARCNRSAGHRLGKVEENIQRPTFNIEHPMNENSYELLNEAERAALHKYICEYRRDGLPNLRVSPKISLKKVATVISAQCLLG